MFRSSVVSGVILIRSLRSRCSPTWAYVLRMVAGVAAGVTVLGGVAKSRAEIQVPLVQLLSEADASLIAQRPQQAAELLDRAIERIERGESLPRPLTVDAVQLAGATAHFRSGSMTKAAQLAARAVDGASTSAGAAEARLILGLSFALQKLFIEAAPVFRALAETASYRDLALGYEAMAARESGDIPGAINALSRLRSSTVRTADWADSALVLVQLYIEQEHYVEAARGLSALAEATDNLHNRARLTFLVVQLADCWERAGEHEKALAAYRTVQPRADLIRFQETRIQGLEQRLAQKTAFTRGNTAEFDALRRMQLRLDLCREDLAKLKAMENFDAGVLYRTGVAFQNRGGAWEAALIFERLIRQKQGAPECEPAFVGLVKAYADARRWDKTRLAMDRFLEAFPESSLCVTALAVAAEAASVNADSGSQLRFLGIAVDQYPKAEMRDSLLLMQAHALFTAGRHEESRAAAERSLAEFPTGRFVEDALYLQAMADFVLGRHDVADTEIHAYLVRFPEGRCAADARYRLAALEFARSRFTQAEKLIEDWLEHYPEGHSQRGEVLSLQGDVFAGTNDIDRALKSYRSAMVLPLSDDGLGYVLDELTRHLQARGEFDAAIQLWADFARTRPDHPFVINAAYWIGHFRDRQGKRELALEQMSAIARRYIADPAMDNVERLLMQLAQQLTRRANTGGGQKKDDEKADAEAHKILSRLLLTDENRASPTTQARLLFTRSEAAALRGDSQRSRRLLLQVHAEIKLESLPAGILGKVGDALRDENQLDVASRFYEQLLTVSPRSAFADYAYVGLGEIALLEENGEEALVNFTAAVDRAGARFKLREATFGRAKALLVLGRLDEARTLCEELAANRAWRGELTAQSVFSLGEILVRRGDPTSLAQAQAHFQRVYLSYKRFTPWVAKAYLKSGELFEQLGQSAEAAATYREMLRDKRLDHFEEAKAARARLTVLEESSV